MTHDPLTFVNTEQSAPSQFIYQLLESENPIEYASYLLKLCETLSLIEDASFCRLEKVEKHHISQTPLEVLKLYVRNENNETFAVTLAPLQGDDFEYFQHYVVHLFYQEIAKLEALGLMEYEMSDMHYVFALCDFLPFHKSLPLYHMEMSSLDQPDRQLSRLKVSILNETFSLLDLDA